MNLLTKASKCLTVFATILFVSPSNSLENNPSPTASIVEETRDSSSVFSTKLSGQVPDSIVSLGNSNYFPNHIFVFKGRAKKNLNNFVGQILQMA